MTFVKKTWKNRACTYPGRRKLTPTGTANIYDVTREEGVVAEEGDAFSQTTMNDLESRIAAGFSDSASGRGALTGGSCDSIFASGFYECGAAVSGLPAAESGMLEVYVGAGTGFQKWVSASGIWVRWSKDRSTWESWRRMYEAVSSGRITVSETEPENPSEGDLWAW